MTWPDSPTDKSCDRLNGGLNGETTLGKKSSAVNRLGAPSDELVKLYGRPLPNSIAGVVPGSYEIASIAY